MGQTTETLVMGRTKQNCGDTSVRAFAGRHLPPPPCGKELGKRGSAVARSDKLQLQAPSTLQHHNKVKTGGATGECILIAH